MSLTTRECLECQAPAHLQQVVPILQAVRVYLSARGLDESVWFNLELATAEALNNAVEHGARERPDATVEVRCHWIGEWVEIAVTDPGFFEAGQIPATLPDDPLDEGGRGLYLMQQLMDEVRHENGAGGHVCLLRKRVGAASWAPSEQAEMNQTIESFARELGNTYEMVTALFRLSEVFAESESFQLFAPRAMTILNEIIHCRAARLCLAEEKRLRLVTHLGLEGAGLAEVSPGSDCIEARVLRNREEESVEETRSLLAKDPLQEFRCMGLVVPIFCQKQIKGTLAVGRSEAFTAGEMMLLRAAAEFLGIAYVNSLLNEQRLSQEQLLREVEIASKIQRSLLPASLPKVGGYDFAGFCLPAAQVGGDYYDVVRIGENSVLVVIADVMGKGLPAALLANMFRTLVRACLGLCREPHQFLQEINRLITLDIAPLDVFITAQAAFIDTQSGQLKLGNAGHCPVLLLQRNAGCYRELTAEGLPMGIDGDAAYTPLETKLQPGEELLFMTDGVYEIMNPQEELLGFDAFAKGITASAAREKVALLTLTQQFMHDFARGTPVRDDCTIITIKCEEESRS